MSASAVQKLVHYPVFTQIHDDGVVLHCFISLLFCVIVLTALVNLSMYVCYTF